MLKARSGNIIDFKVDQEKVQKIISYKEKLGDNFPRIGILVLTYNAKDLIEKTISRIPSELHDTIDEIFIFDDNSPDRTYEFAQPLLETSPWKDKLNIFKNPTNLRYGGNQKAGYRYAIDKGIDYVIMLHGDGQYAPEYVPDLILPMLEENKKVVFGSRMINKRDALRGGMPLYKFVGNQVLTRLENLILGTSLYEFHSGYRAYSTEVLKQLPFEENTNEFHFDTHIIIQCRALGIVIHEVPIKTFYGEEVCNVDGFKYAKDVCIAVLEYRLHQLHLIRRGHFLLKKKFQYSRKVSPYSSHEKILSMITPKSNVLEVGVSQELLKSSIDQKDCVHTFITGSKVSKIEDMNLKREYDYIVLSDYIQKVEDPEKLLKTLSTLLKPEGEFIVSIPNIAIWFYRLSMFIGRFNYGDKGILDRTNLRFFTKFSAYQLIERSALKLEKIEVTSLPFEVVFESVGKSKLLRLVDSIYHCIASLYNKAFAYQFIIKAKIITLDSAKGEGIVKLKK